MDIFLWGVIGYCIIMYGVFFALVQKESRWGKIRLFGWMLFLFAPITMPIILMDHFFLK